MQSTLCFGGNKRKPENERHKARRNVVRMKLERCGRGHTKPGTMGHIKHWILRKSTGKPLKGFNQTGNMLRILF